MKKLSLFFIAILITLSGAIFVRAEQTTPPPIQTPTVVTKDPSSVSENEASLVGNISSVGGAPVSERGFEYGITDFKSKVCESGRFMTGDFTIKTGNSCNGTSSKTLICEKTYQYRAYATNPGGTTYGAVKKFDTTTCSVPQPSTSASPSPTPLPDTLNTWGWSSTIGWIDFRGIKINKNAGNVLEGSGWSPNIGWVRFNNLSNYPTNGAKPAPAKIDPSTGKFSGWIRACAGTIGGEKDNYGADCSSMSSRVDGWDGWIELSDDKHSADRVKIDIDTGEVSGFAWGGNIMGWIKMDSKLNGNRPLSASCTGDSDASGKITFSAHPVGGNGNYEYKWGALAYSQASSYTIPASGKQFETVSLTVKDSVGATFTPTCPTVERKGGFIIGSCTINGINYDPAKISNYFVGDAVNIALTGVWGGNGGPYSYKISAGNGLENYNPSLTYTFAKPAKTTVYIQVKDAQGLVTSNINCSNADISERELTLKIGANGDIANQKEYKTKLNNVFGLKVINTLPKYNSSYIDISNNPDGYSCESVIQNVPGSNWVNHWINVYGVDSISGMNTVQTGKYNFGIICNSNKLGKKEVSVLLNVFNPDEKEI
jgi:hypothetical protein